MSLTVPICLQVILYSEGFESSKTLARKMTQMYKLCSEQLSQQDHYDFGMRAVKSVLVMAGSENRTDAYTSFRGRPQLCFCFFLVSASRWQALNIIETHYSLCTLVCQSLISLCIFLPILTKFSRLVLVLLVFASR